jgi:hypothetical protein
VHRAEGHRGLHVDFLIRRLATWYPPSHPALHFRLASDPKDADSLLWTTVARLKKERWTNASSLYLPPASAGRIDAVYAKRLGAP